ncbi:T9SS type A sorting domain-containing protein [Nostoc sp. NIES-2111]
MARLDTNGLIADSFSVPILNPYPMGILDASFISKKRILISGGYTRILAGNQMETFEIAIVSWPEGVILSRRYFIPNPDLNRISCVRQTEPNKIYLIGGVGNCLGAQRIDTLGNQTGGFCLYTDTLGGGVGGDAMLLPDGRWAVRINYCGPIASNPTRPHSSVLAVVDTLGHMYWRHKEDFPVNRGIFGFMQLIGVNDDGSMLVQYQRPYDYIIRRYSITGVLEASWQTYDRLSDTVGRSSGPAIYIGNDKAYIIGAGGVQRPDPSHQRTRYWAAYLDGTGNPFDPTATRGPRMKQEPLAATVYPNPATQRIYIDSDKPLAYRILSATGALVQQGIVSRSQPAELAALVPGIYQLLLSDGIHTIGRRFVKQ